MCFLHLVVLFSYGAGEPEPIAVFMDFQSQPSAAAVAQMKREISAIMKPSGLAFDWRMINDRRLGDSFHDLLVLSFKGRCQAEGPTYDELGPIGDRQVLASTRISDGHVLPFSDVECDTIRRYIAPSVQSAHPDQREDMLGRALGRIVAHEMYHMLAHTKTHAESGVARSFHTRMDLTGPEFHFSRQETELLHGLVAKTPLPIHLAADFTRVR